MKLDDKTVGGSVRGGLRFLAMRRQTVTKPNLVFKSINVLGVDPQQSTLAFTSTLLSTTGTELRSSFECSEQSMCACRVGFGAEGGEVADKGVESGSGFGSSKAVSGEEVLTGNV